MRIVPLIFFLALCGYYQLHTMPGAAGGGASQESEGEEEGGGGDDAGEEAEKPAQAKMPASAGGVETDEAGTAQEAVVESKRLEGVDIIQLENTQELIKKDNPEIVRLSEDAEVRLREFDQIMPQVVDKVNQQQATYREISEKRKELYQSIRALMGSLKERVIAPEQNKAQSRDSIKKSER